MRPEQAQSATGFAVVSFLLRRIIAFRVQRPAQVLVRKAIDLDLAPGEELQGLEVFGAPGMEGAATFAILADALADAAYGFDQAFGHMGGGNMIETAFIGSLRHFRAPVQIGAFAHLLPRGEAAGGVAGMPVDLELAAMENPLPPRAIPSFGAAGVCCAEWIGEFGRWTK